MYVLTTVSLTSYSCRVTCDAVGGQKAQRREAGALKYNIIYLLLYQKLESTNLILHLALALTMRSLPAGAAPHKPQAADRAARRQPPDTDNTAMTGEG